jgi:hypothetical protein
MNRDTLWILLHFHSTTDGDRIFPLDAINSRGNNSRRRKTNVLSNSCRYFSSRINDAAYIHTQSTVGANTDCRCYRSQYEWREPMYVINSI